MAAARSPSGENTFSRLLIDLYPEAARLAASRYRYLAELEPFTERPLRVAGCLPTCTLT